MTDAQIKQLFLIIDFGAPVPMDILMGNIKDCKTNDDLNAFINKRVERIKSITTVYMTSWGELFSKTYTGMNCLGRTLNELSPQMVEELLDSPDFLKVFIPSGRKEILQMPWLNNYILRSLKIRRMAFTDKVAS